MTVVQNIDQYALFDSYFYVRVAQDGIYEFTGSWFVVSGNQDMLANESARVKSIVSVLLDFARVSSVLRTVQRRLWKLI